MPEPPSPLIAGLVLSLFALLGALVAAAETALFGLDPAQLRQLREKGGSRGTLAAALLSRPKRLRSTLKATAITCDIGLAVLGTSVLSALPALDPLPILWRNLLAMTVVVLLLLVGVRLVPKAYATAHPVQVARTVAVPLLWLRRCWTPVNELLVRSADRFERSYTKRPPGHMDMDTLEQALDLTTGNGTTTEEQRILRGIVRFSSIEVRQVMRPRTEMVALSEDLSFPELLKAVTDSGFSRIPVYRGTADRIVGILHGKDLLPHIAVADLDWRGLLRDPWFVPEQKKLDSLLEEFRARRVHLAVVVDEYGGTSGIITLEDVIEEIVGEITDEHDDDELAYSKLDEHSWVFEGRTSLTDMYRILGIEGDEFEENKGDSGTLGGFVLELSGRFPTRGERITFREYIFTVESADDKRVRRVKVQRNNGSNE